ncbi:MAG: ferritin-like domain-containing protein [Planctomycetota bacterium]
MPASETDRQRIVELLITAYHAELETVMNYIANAVNLDGVRAEEIKAALQADVAEELTHAQTIARRIKTLGGSVPGSMAMTMTQSTAQPPASSTDVVAVIKGVIDAEDSAIAGYEEIIRATDGIDYVTQDLAITLLGDEEEHRRQFMVFLKEYES